jgi:hypothetical protein
LHGTFILRTLLEVTKESLVDKKKQLGLALIVALVALLAFWSLFHKKPVVVAAPAAPVIDQPKPAEPAPAAPVEPAK